MLNQNYYFFFGAGFLGLFLFDFSNSSHFKSSSKVLIQKPSNFIGSVPISLLSSIIKFYLTKILLTFVK